MSSNPRLLERAIGYGFSRGDLLEQALTHRSAGGQHNERLEFLGDAVLGFVIAEALCERFPSADEGRLSRMRASLVKRETLALLARDLRLGDYLRLGAGEIRTGGFARDSILADAMEALLGAVYLDAGYGATRALVLRLFAEHLGRTSLDRSGKDPKTRLQEWLQARHRPLPEYGILATGGDQHAQTFVVTCTLPDRGEATQARGSSRRRAEQAAAESMLERLQGERANDAATGATG